MAAALTRYASAIEPAARRMQSVKQSHQAFFEAAEQEPGKGMDDPELEQASKILEATMNDMAPSMAKAAQWFGHPQVRQALERLETVMNGLDGGDSDSEEEDED